jgi:hypothetical protein
MNATLFDIMLAVDKSRVLIPKVGADDATLKPILKMVFAASGALALMYVTLAGFKYTTSGGDPTAVAKAKNQILYGVIGLVVSLSAYSIVAFVLTNIGA